MLNLYYLPFVRFLLIHLLNQTRFETESLAKERDHDHANQYIPSRTRHPAGNIMCTIRV